MTAGELHSDDAAVFAADASSRSVNRRDRHEEIQPEDISQFVESRLQRGRELTGTGGTPDRRRLFRLLREEKVSAYPMFALLALEVGGTLAGAATGVVSPDISRTFGLTPQFFTSLLLVGQVLSFAIPLMVARYVQNRARRALVVLASQGAWCLVTGLQGLVTTVAALAVIQLLDTATSSAGGTVSQPLMIDLYPPTVRVRVISFLTSAEIVTGLVATGIVAVLTGPLDLTWRGVFVVSAVIAFLTLLFSLGLRDPGYGRYDTERVREDTRDVLEGSDADASDPGPTRHVGVRADSSATTKLSMAEALRRIWAIRTMRLLLLATLVSSLPAPVDIYLQFYYANRFSLGTSQRALIALVTGAVALGSYIVLAPVGDRIFQRSPKMLFYITGALELVGAALSLAQLFVYSIAALVLFAVLGSAFTGLSGPAVTVGTQSIVPASLRPHVGAMSGIFALIGTAAGTALLGGLTTSLGIPLAVLITTLIGLIATVMSMLSGRYVRKDLDAVVEEVTETEFLREAAASGRSVPMLGVRNLEFAYGQTQVLFGVDLAVHEAEIVALLGVNGAGKSTLLRAISGLGLPTRGSIRLHGQDITYLDAERRTRLGITQVPGGRAVFGELSVLENLRCYTFGLPAGERRAASGRLDEALDAFPQLRHRRHSPAHALSGGEQQMLGLAKAFIMRPRLLLIDELSLGLAPKVVADLLDVVRAINARGTAVMLVEQSVNVALTIAQRAYFLERGEVRFEGSCQDLLDSDLLRAVFLNNTQDASR